MNRQKNIPELRFPEFEGEWEEKQFGNVFTFKSTNSFSRENLNYESGFVRNIHYGDIHTKFPTIIDAEKEQIPFINPEIDISRISDDNYCREGDLLFADASEDYEAVGKCVEIGSLFNTRLLSGLHTIMARPKLKDINKGFAGYLMKSNSVRRQIVKIAQGTKVLSISANRLSGIIINYPLSINNFSSEQQKIATFFTAIDQKISQLKKKHQLLEQYKKGVMQKIFSQQIRFKDDDGREFPKWEKKRLGEFLIQEIREVEKPNVNYLAIGVRSHCKGTFLKPESEPDKIAMDKLFVVKEGDLIVNITFAWEGAIAIAKKEDDGGLVSHRFPKFTFRDDIACVGFFKHIIIQKRFREILDLISPGGAGRNRVLSKKDFMKILWKIPSIPEQTKIANFLSAIDDKIQHTQRQIEQAEQWKKGLMQKMFV